MSSINIVAQLILTHYLINIIILTTGECCVGTVLSPIDGNSISGPRRRPSRVVVRRRRSPNAGRRRRLCRKLVAAAAAVHRCPVTW